MYGGGTTLFKIPSQSKHTAEIQIVNCFDIRLVWQRNHDGHAGIQTSAIHSRKVVDIGRDHEAAHRRGERSPRLDLAIFLAMALGAGAYDRLRHVGRYRLADLDFRLTRRQRNPIAL